jgi:hypothetical protein
MALNLIGEKTLRKSQLKEAPGSRSANRIFALPVDQIGAWTSALCVIHCLLIPVVLSISAVSAHFLLPKKELIGHLQSPLLRLEPLHC